MLCHGRFEAYHSESEEVFWRTEIAAHLTFGTWLPSSPPAGNVSQIGVRHARSADRTPAAHAHLWGNRGRHPPIPARRLPDRVGTHERLLFPRTPARRLDVRPGARQSRCAEIMARAGLPPS